jgi:hypothetical protein
MSTDLPEGYRWATEAETEEYGADPITHPEMLVVVRTADATGQPYTEGEADLALPATRLVPDFSMDVSGEYTGNPYPEQREYRITMAHDPTDGAQMLVVDSGGAFVAEPLMITPELAEGIGWMAHTNHDLGAYEDDWTLPTGMGRTLSWTLDTDGDILIVLSEGQITEVADWLEYATGEKTWDWAEQGEVYEV